LLYKNFDSCILVFDKTNRESFKECQEYFSDTIKEKCKSDIKVILVGNKIDLENEIEVSYEEAAKFALLNDYLYIETSCARNKNVFEAFEKIIGLKYLFLKEQKKYKDEKYEKYSIKLLKYYNK
jgi:small GTP-binding protein